MRELRICNSLRYQNDNYLGCVRGQIKETYFCYIVVYDINMKTRRFDHMKILNKLSFVFAAFLLFVAQTGVGTNSTWFLYEPDVPGMLKNKE